MQSDRYSAYERLFCVIAVIGIAVLLKDMLGISEAASAKAKPQPPLQITIAPADPSITSENIKPGDDVSFVVNCRSLEDADKLQISVSLPKNAELVAGELAWKGPVGKNEMRSLSFTVKAPPKQGGVIKARAKIEAAEGYAFGAEAHYVLGTKAKDKPEAQRSTKKTGKGRDVIEYK